MTVMAHTVSELLTDNVWLAPMAGIGDPIFRHLCREQGAGLTYTEMISAKGLSFGDVGTHKLLVLADNESSAGVQLFGSDPALIADQAARIEDAWQDQLALIDINMGCPVPKVTKRGEGCALMRDPQRAAAIVESVCRSVSVPVSAKFRRGWDNGSDTAVEFAKRMEAAGASLVCVHGRSAVQLYRGSADWDIIARVKHAVSIPVIGNGDIFVHEDISRMEDATGVDGVMIARGARGNPWIFSEHVPSQEERLRCAIEHARGLCTLDPRHGPSRMRKHIVWYVTGMPDASQIRAAAMRCASFEEYESLFLKVIDSLDAADAERAVS